MSPRHRQLVIVRGSEAQTREQVEAIVAARSCLDVRPHELADRLGQAFDVVVVDGHGGIDADALGLAHGLVFGGGALVLRLGPEASPPDPRLAVFPYTVADVGRRFATHVERVLTRFAIRTPSSPGPAERITEGTAEQAEIVARLSDRFADESPTRTVLIADRGRGKSSALGLALRSVAEQRRSENPRPVPS